MAKDIFIKKEKKSLENALLQAGLLTPEQLTEIQKEQRKTDQPLRAVLVQKGLVTEETIARALSAHLGIPYIDLEHYYIDAEAVKLLPEDLARNHLLIATFILEDTITVTLADPFDIFAIDEVERISQKKATLAVSTPSAITRAIEGNYKMTHSMREVIDNLSEGTALATSVEKAEEKRLAGLIEDNPVVKLVNMIITQAIRDRASDIHIEPSQENVRIRYRIDGVLSENLLTPKHLHSALVSRVKVLSGMNIAEKRIPQDGHVEIKKENMDIDLRVSTLPTIWGEKVVIRILNRKGIGIGLQELGFDGKSLQTFQTILNQPHGMILTTGPTGSGKTTTLYAALNTINTADKNIITLEDPVEYRLPVVNQSQVNPAAGLTFATGLRSILRQDPDVIMVGEIRDIETAQLAIQAALTGHQVFSSLHTNDAPSTITRLIDMGIEPYLVASTLLCAIGQRLVRALCPRCKKPYPATPEEKNCFKIEPSRDLTFHKPVGCKYCERIGYLGRTGLFELLTLDEEIRDLIVEKKPSSVIRDAAVRNGMQTLRAAGLEKIMNGATSVSEVMRVTLDEEIA